MRTIDFFYTTKLTFDNYVHDHSFALRCIPMDIPSQKILSCEMNISPFVSTNTAKDAFGNIVTAGYISKEHRFLDFEISGKAITDSSNYQTDFMPCYLYQSKYTHPDENAKKVFTEEFKGLIKDNAYDTALAFCDRLSDIIMYEKGATDINTTASESLSLEKGVCQDFSHVLIMLLRMAGIPARYIAGLAACDGETHSWTEFWYDDKWIGIDPANNCLADDSYLKLSHGRDFKDAAVDRGIMFGAYTRQMQLVSSSLALSR